MGLKKYLFAVTVFSSLLFSESITPETMYPDTADTTFDTRPPETNSTETIQEVQYINNESVSTVLSPSSIQTTQEGDFGKTEISKEIDYTNALDLEKLYTDRTKDQLSEASALAGDMRRKAANKFKDKNGNAIDPTRPETFSTEAIVKNFEEDSDTRSALAFKQELYDEMRAKLVVDAQIQCYITRKINNSFFCPLPNHTTADFGGGAKDSQEEAQERCDRECRVQTQCVEHLTGAGDGVEIGGEQLLPINEQVYFLNPEQMTKEFSFSYELRNVNDVQERYFEDGLVRGRITIKGEDPNNNEVTLYNGYVYEMKRDGGRVTLEINKRLKNLKVHFFDSYIFDPRYMDEVSLTGDNPEVAIKDINVGYSSNKRYFCPITQFEVDSTKCDGEIKFITIGSTTQSVCVPRRDLLPSTRSDIDGGYYTKESCLASCWEEAKCIPTYRHLSIDPNNLTSDMYDIEYGCVDSDDNKGCTKERCKQMFEGDVQPSKEIVWEKDDAKIITVESGVKVADVIRPRVDFQGELGANGTEDRQDLFNEEMKDYAYQKMIEEESFNVTPTPLNDDIRAKWAADVRVNSASSQISFNLLYKAQASLYDSGATVYLYPVIEMFITYFPYKAIYYQGKTYYPGNDKNMRAMDSVLMIRNEETKEWFPFNRKMWMKYYLPVVTDTGEVIYKWITTTGNLRIKQDIFSGGKYVAYGSGYTVPHMGIPLTPKSDKPWEEYLLYPNLSSLIYQEGVLITNNTSTLGKVYTYADLNQDRKGYYFGHKVYIVASRTPLDLAGVASRINDSVLVYDSRDTRKTNTEIPPDTQYDDDRVKLYSLGTKDKKSVFMKIKPNSTELEQRGLIFMFLHQ